MFALKTNDSFSNCLLIKLTDFQLCFKINAVHFKVTVKEISASIKFDNWQQSSCHQSYGTIKKSTLDLIFIDIILFFTSEYSTSVNKVLLF